MGSKGQQMAVLFTTQLAEHSAVQNSLADIKWSFLLLEYSGHMRSAHLPSITTNCRNICDLPLLY